MTYYTRANVPNGTFLTPHFASVRLCIHVVFLNNERGKREILMLLPLLLLIKFVLLLIIFQVSRLICWSPIGDFHWNFSRQIFFPGFVWVLENLESPRILLCIFQDWKVLEKGHWSWKVLEFS